MEKTRLMYRILINPQKAAAWVVKTPDQLAPTSHRVRHYWIVWCCARYWKSGKYCRMGLVNQNMNTGGECDGDKEPLESMGYKVNRDNRRSWRKPSSKYNGYIFTYSQKTVAIPIDVDLSINPPMPRWCWVQVRNQRCLDKCPTSIQSTSRLVQWQSPLDSLKQMVMLKYDWTRIPVFLTLWSYVLIL